MATVYSLVCWGGLTGKVVSISATTDVVTLTNHGLRNGTKLWPSGTLPPELSTSTPVYARSTGTNTFTLHTSAAGAIANTGQILFAGSSTYADVTLKSDLVVSPSTALSAYGLSDLSRWGASGSERIYDGLNNWNSGRSGASGFDIEYCEIGESFSDVRNSTLTISVPSAQNVITTTIAGIRTAGFHAGTFPPATPTLTSGYELYSASSMGGGNFLSLSRYRDVVDGIIVRHAAGFGVSACIYLNTQCAARNCIIYNSSAGLNGVGVNLFGALSESSNNIIYGWASGVSPTNYAAGVVAINNTVTACSTGFTSGGQTYGFYYNNISVGNTTNWAAAPGANIEFASNNAGLSGEAWLKGTGATRVTIATTDFSNYAGKNFRPAMSSSPQVDTGATPYGYLIYDIQGVERPSYNNGGAEAVDIGAYEYDNGYGPHPATHTLTLTNVVVGSRVHIRDQADTVTHYDDIAAASSVVIPITVYGDSRDNWRIKVRKASAAPYYQPWETIMTATAGASSIYVSQIPD